MPQAALDLRAAYSVQKSSHIGGIFSSQKPLQRQNSRFKKATQEAAFSIRKATLKAEFPVQKATPKAVFSVQKSNPGGVILGSKKQPWRRHIRYTIQSIL